MDSVQSSNLSSRNRRALNACGTCRARKVKCDERPGRCTNCERLQIVCIPPINAGTPRVAAAGALVTGSSTNSKRRRTRTFRSCTACRDSKLKCNGERPSCGRCQRKSTSCVYDTEREPVWVQNIAPTNIGIVARDGPEYPEKRDQGLLHLEPSSDSTNPSSLEWLTSELLPSQSRLHALLEAYFNNVHPIRAFAFIHKPTFLRMLDEQVMTGTSEQALLFVMCALGARFYALEYNEFASPLTKDFVQYAGRHWAKAAERILLSDYSTISVNRLKAFVLLHDFEARVGNYAQSFILTGIITRLSHALQINIERSTNIMCRDEINTTSEITLREMNRRLMWACYMVDVWAGGGVDQLTLINEDDIKIQLPCNERKFIFQIPCITERLCSGTILDFIPVEDIPENPLENLGMSAFYVRIINIWQHVLRYVKHLDEMREPWLPNSEFTQLMGDINHWKATLPPFLEFSPDNIYIRKDSSQLGGLFLIHCLYHHAICDLNRISLPDLFKIREPFSFPKEQRKFVAQLQGVCFEQARHIAKLFSTVMRHGVKHFADPILPSYAYNSNRIMLFYIARILDLTELNALPLVNETIALVKSNNKALCAMSLMYPLAESLFIISERWVTKLQTSFTRRIEPDPANTPGEAQQLEVGAISSSAFPSVSGQELNHLSRFRVVRNSLELESGSHAFPFSPDTDRQSEVTQTQPETMRTNNMSYEVPSPNLPVNAGDSVAETLQPYTLDLNDLQEFFEWDLTENMPETFGFDGMGPMGGFGSL
ncbi:hypothetical protein EJ04DRAFT_512978 [Polyplosphaeria fusca]|uniref:Zn(2)-C6 fungal-type domain-containing protein n=1 Tax=Polyplosphaeria fusca TaxID=682080 RepID=A0A9P4UYZ6_9PLEO|nr:hypothetical protein EJ04DRAFT_512978 [Polyplosphaeria fusca]